MASEQADEDFLFPIILVSLVICLLSSWINLNVVPEFKNPGKGGCLGGSVG